MNIPSQVELIELAAESGLMIDGDDFGNEYLRADKETSIEAALEKFAQLLLQRDGGSAGADAILNDLAWSVKKLQAYNPKHGKVLSLVIDQIFAAKSKSQQPTAPGGEVVETQWRRVNKVSGWASRWYFLDDDDDIENVRKNFTNSEWEIETRDLVAAPSPAKESLDHD